MNLLTVIVILSVAGFGVEASRCGCNDCTTEVLNTLAGAYTCGARIDYLQNDMGFSEVDACKRVAGVEFPDICGPSCDPDRCDLPPTPVTPAPTYIPDPPSPVYCFPPEGSRVSFNMWNGYSVEVKESSSLCGPGSNYFSSQSISTAGNELTLKYQKVNGRWESSEVRVTQPGEETFFDYGTFRFHVKSVDIIDENGVSISNVLPIDMVLGLFTWDATERNDVNENYNHEVDVEIARWGVSDYTDVQFLMQPPGSPQLYRFHSGTNQDFSQSNQWYSFEWLPGQISWQSSAGGGQSHTYTTEAAVLSGRRDYIQCLPAEVEIRMNLWNFLGANVPDGMSDGQRIEVVIDDFTYEPASVSFIEEGEYCSKHCQCQGSCINSKCSSTGPATPTSSPVSSPPTTTCGCSTCTDAALNTMAGAYTCGARIDYLQNDMGFSEVDACKRIAGVEFPDECAPCDPDRCGDSIPTSSPTSTPTVSKSNPTSSPTTTPTKSPVATCDDSSSKFWIQLSNGKRRRRTCVWVKKNPANRCRLDGASESCPSTCGTCE
jgi:hypothetical protein